jgi:hypothetical protein
VVLVVVEMVVEQVREHQVLQIPEEVLVEEDQQLVVPV